MTTWIVLPTYNEAENLPQIISALFMLEIPRLHILVVDDASPDGTGEIADRLSDDNSSIHVLHRSGKLGLGSAYVTGFKYCLEQGATIIGQMDVDFSHSPEMVPALIKALETADVALGSRYVEGGKLDTQWPVWRKWLSKFGNVYARLILRIPVVDATGGFRFWRQQVLSRIPLDRVKSNGYAFQIEMIYLAYRMGFNIVELPIYFTDRRWGQSKMNLKIQMEAAYRVWEMKFRYRKI